MSESIRDRTSTIMRMAGNIAPIIIQTAPYTSSLHPSRVATLAVDYATAIVDEVLKRNREAEQAK